ncbi:MAG: ADOP family duplicated permease [Terracidiphilus sp.]
MDLLRTLVARLAALFRHRQLDADLDDELRFHIDLATKENIQRGLPHAAARTQALHAFGGITQTREAYRLQRGMPFLEQISRDIQYSIRQLRKSPGFALTAILTLALAIGANTAIFSVMHAVLLRMLPVRDPGQLFYVTHEHVPDDAGITGDYRYSSSLNIYYHLRQDRTVLSDVIAYVPLAFNKTAVRMGDSPEEIRANEVSGNFFSALGVSMAAGAAFTSDDETKHSAVAVISYGYWQARFNHNPDVVGMTIYIRGVPFIITGVAAPQFYGVESGGSATDLWIPLQNHPEVPAWGVPATTGRTIYATPNWWALFLMVRLKPSVTLQQAAAHLNPIYAHAAREFSTPPAPNAPPLQLQLITARGLGTSNTDYEQPLHVLMGMVVLVLLIACVNIVMLLVARNSSREREFALRLALGASRWPLLRQLLAESFLLVTTGALLGWLFAIEATHLLARWAEFEVSLAPDTPVLAFTFSISATAAILFGLAPLRIASSVPVVLALKSSSSAQSTTSRSRAVSGKILIALQMAFCCVLLFASGLLLRTLLNYRNTDLGIQADRVLAVGVHPLGSPSRQAKLAFYRALLPRLQSLPGVSSVALAELRPGTGWSDGSLLVLDGRTYSWDDGKNLLESNWVSPSFTGTLGIPLLAGRNLRDSDTLSTPLVAIVNQTFAERYFAQSTPIGHFIGRDKGRAQIVGVVRNSKYTSTNEKILPMAWYSYAQGDSIEDLDVEMRISGVDPLSVLPAVQRVVRQMDPNIPLNKPQILSDAFKETYLMPTLVARLGAFFGVLAALLVSVGLYGTLAYRVSRRTSEIGVRLALGAQRTQILWMFLRESLILVAAGLAAGLPLAWFTARWMSSLLYELSAHDSFSFVAGAAGVLIVSIAASLIPARRAASIDPMKALRME